ncbi:MobP2 family relaxase [Enterococcus gallinarum]|uniref:MobP2 family relaxase n=1 Tax=Enterococcus gallinarum TaxID=1353 RepID=UPI001AD75510|nr:MobP2 family relaxase [Enterococcus gallinarum]MBO6420063.1 hypothetical protein [Enterococcus gallinarum]MBO6423060.1 hypothetical protein [Enterococcus gallinarum]
MARQTAGVIYSAAFVVSSAQAFKEFIDYMNRSAAVRNENFDKYNAFSVQNQADSYNSIEGGNETMFSTYNDYMSNPEKTSSSFTRHYDQAPIEVMNHLKDYFTQAQENQSPLWQMVFSFKNEWLVEHGLMNEKTNRVDTVSLIDAARKAVTDLEKKEGLEGEWSGAIHYNTKHIHVHIGYVEKEPTREWGYYEHPTDPEKTGWQYMAKFKQSAIKSTRRTFVNTLLKNESQLKELSQSIRQQVALAKENRSDFLVGRYEALATDLLQALPDNKYFWKYGFAERHGFKEPLDRMVNLFLNTDGKETMEKVVRLLKPISDEYESAYGNPKNAPSYYENQLYGKNGLYAQIGNQILHEVRTFAKSQQMQKAVGNMTAEEFEALQKEQEILPIDLESPTEQDFITPEMEDVFHLLNEIPPLPDQEEVEQPISHSILKTEGNSASVERTKALSEAFELMKKHFDKRDESLDQRHMGIQYKLNQENANREDTIERRAMYIHAVDSETDFVHYEPTSIQKHKTLDEEFVSVKELNSSDRSKDNEQHNLDHFSKKNRTRILNQNPGATFVYGPQQWKLNGRKVREEEVDQPLVIIAPRKIEDSVTFEEIFVYDISQTEAYQPTAAELRELRKNENAKGKSTQRGMTRFQDHRKEIEMRRMVRSLRKSCENSLQHYLNERAYREMQYETQSNI